MQKMYVIWCIYGNWELNDVCGNVLYQFYTDFICCDLEVQTKTTTCPWARYSGSLSE